MSNLLSSRSHAALSRRAPRRPWLGLLLLMASAMLGRHPARAAGTFPTKVDYPTGTNPLSVTVGDFNGDGMPDLAVANGSSASVSVLLGNGDGTFATKVDYPTGSSPQSVTVGDFNGDGRPDLAVANYSSASVSVLLGNGDGTFATNVDYPTGSSPRSVTVGDFDGDGMPDLAVANEGSNTVSVLLGNGDGTFATKVDYPTGSSPRSVTVGDFDGDGRPDLATANFGSNTVSVLLGNGDGTFATKVDYPTGSSPLSVTVGDFNGDGMPDLATANFGSNTVSVLLGNGAGTFATKVDYPTGSSPLSVTVGDFDGDGMPDLATANFGSNTVSVLLGNGAGTFATKVDYPTGSSPLSVTVGDFNGDGRPDLAVANYGSNTVSVLLNDTAQTGSSLTVNTTADHDDGTCGVVDCTLREAINAANAVTGTTANSPATITFDATIFATRQTITLTLGALPAIVNNLSITGPTALNTGVTLDANHLSRVLQVTSGTSSISNLSLINGTVTGTTGTNGGTTGTNGGTGGPGNGGGIDNSGTLTLNACTLSGNTASGGNGGTGGLGMTVGGSGGTGGTGSGGGIDNSGTLTLNACTLSGNTASGGNGGTGGPGNTASGGNGGTGGLGNGGGIDNSGTLTLNACTLSGNTASGGNGGPGMTGGGSGGTGGLGNGGGIDNSGTLTVNACTLSGNTASGGNGGTGGTGSSGGTGSGGGIANSGTLNLSNSIVAGNAATANVNISGSFTDQGFNITSGTAAAAGLQTDNNGNAVLADNGGPTKTIALVAGSAAIDQGNSTLPTDQRGLPRPSDFNTIPNANGGNGSDIGAFELQAPADQPTGNTFVVNTNTDHNDGSCSMTDCTLREAIAAANIHVNSGGPDAITFNIPNGQASGGVYTIAPTSVLPDITDPVIIDGTTQPGFNTIIFNNAPVIVLNGAGVPAGTNGLHLTAGSSTVRGLAINGFRANPNGFNQFSGVGILIDTNGSNTIIGNYIGTGADGATAVGNGFGILVFADSNTIGGVRGGLGNLVSGNTGVGIFLIGTGNTVQGNTVGTTADGTTALANGYGMYISSSGNTIGGVRAGAGNLVSGNGDGIYLQGGPNTVQGNTIGTNAAGTGPIPNFYGIVLFSSGNVIGGPVAGAGNLVSGNYGDGIFIDANSNTVQGNKIGTDAAGATAVANGGNGIYIYTSNNTIGGAAGAGNLISGNRGEGIHIQTGTGNALLNNAIYANGPGVNGKLGINLVGGTEDGYGVTANDTGDGDTGPNDLQNYPVLTTATNFGSTTVTGTFNSTPNHTYTIQYFASDAKDPSGYGEGQTFIGQQTVTTDNNGDAPALVFVPANQVVLGHFVTATATDTTTGATLNDTSEFSNAIATDVPAVFQFSSGSSSVNEGSGTATITVVRTGSGTGTATVNYATSDGTATAGSDYTATSGTLTFANGVTSQSFTVPITDDSLNEDNETVNLTLSSPSSNALIGSPNPAVLTIVDNDPLPPLSINSPAAVTVDGTTNPSISFTATLGAVSGRTVTVDYATSSGTATAGTDYTTTNGTLTFAPGETSKTITVPTKTNATSGPDKTFTVNLSSPANATLANNGASGVGTIHNGSAAPGLSINNVSANEGNSGTMPFAFKVTLGAASGNTVTVDYATSDGTATAGSDYTATSGTLTFTPGQTSQTISVAVIGNTIIEPDKTFKVTLSNPTGATLTTASGLGTILNDDTTPPPTVTPTPAPGTPVLSAQFTNVATGEVYRRLPTLIGAVSETNAPANSTLTVQVTVQRVSDGKYFDGNGFGATSFPLPATVSHGTFVLAAALLPNNALRQQLLDGQYVLTTTATDGTNQSAPASVTLTVDGTPPTISITAPGADAKLLALGDITGKATDVKGGTGVKQVLVSIIRVADGKAFNGTTFVTPPVKKGVPQLPTLTAGYDPKHGVWALRKDAKGNKDFTPGNYRLLAVALDGAGNRAQATRGFSLIAPTAPGALSTATASVASSSVTLRFFAALEAESASDAANYSVTVNGKSVTAESAGYNSSNHGVALGLPEGSLKAGDAVVVKWSLLDGKGDAVAGQSEALTAR